MGRTQLTPFKNTGPTSYLGQSRNLTRGFYLIGYPSQFTASLPQGQTASQSRCNLGAPFILPVLLLALNANYLHLQSPPITPTTLPSRYPHPPRGLDQLGGGQTIQFRDATGDKELQIAAYPYTQLDLTLNREGQASATHDQPDHLEIVDVVRDDLFTVLFVKDGVRYSVVTLSEQEAWLRQILTTWHII